MMFKRCVIVGMAMFLSASLTHADEVRLPMPAITVELNKTPYPDAALKNQLQGRVLVAFNISKRGRAEEENVVEAEPQDVFEKSALDLVKKVKFSVPDNWEQAAGPLQRYRLSVVYKLYPCPEPCTSPKRHDDADDFVIISAQIK